MSVRTAEETGSTFGLSSSKKIIYDFGANNGDDLPYYLKKADLVVAVEANPSLCRLMEARFSAAIHADKLRIENLVVVGDGEEESVDFYLHKRHHVLGQLSQPDESVIGDYDRVSLHSKPVMQVLRKHGAPYYIKLDIEGGDEAILQELFRNRVTPPFISAESTSIRVFALLAAMGEYRSFKLVEGATVAKKFKDCTISVNGSYERYSFPGQSAGPFGEDIPGPWMNGDDLFNLLAKKRMGWRDIHATNLFEVDPVSGSQRKRLMRRHLRGWLLAKFRSFQKAKS